MFAFTLEVRSVTGRTDLQALFLYFKPCDLTLELLNACA
jgi:hypothetical protein